MNCIDVHNVQTDITLIPVKNFMASLKFQQLAFY